LEENTSHNRDGRCKFLAVVLRKSDPSD
jgi:hypothetical protein